MVEWSVKDTSSKTEHITCTDKKHLGCVPCSNNRRRCLCKCKKPCSLAPTKPKLNGSNSTLEHYTLQTLKGWVHNVEQCVKWRNILWNSHSPYHSGLSRLGFPWSYSAPGSHTHTHTHTHRQLTVLESEDGQASGRAAQLSLFLVNRVMEVLPSFTLSSLSFSAYLSWL